MEQSSPTFPVAELAAAHSSPGAVGKAMIALTKLLAEGEPLRLADLARKTGLPKATLHRVLGTMRDHKVLQLQGQRYSPGECLIGTMQWINGKYLCALRSASTPYLVDLHRTTGLTASLGFLTGDSVQYANRVHGHRAIRTPSYHSDKAPAWDTAIGRILLAYDATRTTQLYELRRRGIAYNEDGYLSGLTCMAVPVAVGAQMPVALALSGQTGHINRDAAAAALRYCAHAMAPAVSAATSPWLADDWETSRATGPISSTVNGISRASSA